MFLLTLLVGAESLAEDQEGKCRLEAKRLLDLFETHGEETTRERYVEELEYFRDNGYMEAVEASRDLISKFREEGIIWGVGRGSMCSSIIFYVLGLHDVDPIKYDIPFSELTKETRSKFS